MGPESCAHHCLRKGTCLARDRSSEVLFLALALSEGADGVVIDLSHFTIFHALRYSKDSSQLLHHVSGQ